PPRLGQHFLTDTRAIDAIFAALAPGHADHVLEIGPGGGALTQPLAEAAGRLTAVEIDPVWTERLQARFAGSPHVEIVAGDILAFDLAALAPPRPGGRLLVAGNLPYSVATQVVRRV